METFVFISGFLYAIGKKNNVNYLILLKKKFKRLMIPSIIFSILYFSLFKEYNSFLSTIYNIILGCGHLWFLPMLFGCFICIFSIEKFNVKDRIILYLFPLLIILSVLNIPFHISKICYFFCFFYLGYRMVVYKKEYLYNSKVKFILLLYFVLFIINNLLINQYEKYIYENIVTCLNNLQMQFLGIQYTNNNIYFSESFIKLLEVLLKAGYSFCGLTLIIKLCIYFAKKNEIISYAEKISKIASCGMGVYIIQQFILMGLYYKTTFCNSINNYLIPWCAFLITILFSIVFVLVAKRYKIGRYLLG